MDDQTRRVAQGIAYGGIVILAAVLIVLLVMRLAEVLGILALGVIVGITLAPLAERGERVGIPPAFSGLFVYAVVTGALVAFFWYAIPVVLAEAPTGEDIAKLGEQYEQFADGTPLPPLERLITYVEDVLEDAPLEDIAGQALVLVNVIFYILAISVVGLFVTVARNSVYTLFVSLVAVERRPATAEFLEEYAYRLRRYVLATFITMLAVGSTTYVGLVLLDIPFAVPLAVLAFIFEVIPIVGPWIAFLPAFAVALTQGVFEAIAVAVLYFVIQQLESYVLVPIIHGRETRMPGLLIVTAIIVAFPLMGIVGALLALPVALFFHTLVINVIVPWRQGQLRSRDLLRRPAAPVEAEPEEPREVDEASS